MVSFVDKWDLEKMRMEQLVREFQHLQNQLLVKIKIQVLLPFLLAFAAGAMLYVVISELIPESQKNSNKSLVSIITLLGFIIMMILDISLG